MSEENPWKTIGTRLVYENSWIRLREDKVIRPDGEPGIYSVVDTRIATGVVALTENYEVYLVGQFRYPTNQYSWEIIEGGTDEGEGALATAKRELREEAGLVAKNWLQLGDEFHLSNCFTSEVGYVFLAWGLSHVPAAPEGTEVLKLKKLEFGECLQSVHNGTIKDSVSIIGLTRAERLLREFKLW